MSNLKNKVVLVTGASSGIGAGLVREFHRQGAHVVLAARRLERIEALAKSLPGPGKSLWVQCDVCKDGDVEKAVSRAEQEFGRLDIVVANAGFGVAGKVEKLELEDYRRQFETNVFGVLRTFKASVDALKKSKGNFTAIGSINGYIALPGTSAYGMSKFAVRALCDSLYAEMKPYGVSVTHIAPGFVVSDIRKVNNQGVVREDYVEKSGPPFRVSTEKAALEIVTAVKKNRREQVITGHGKIAVFFKRHLPCLFDWVISKTNITGRPEPK